MCLATSCRSQSSNPGPAGRLWNWIRGNPLRLFSCSGLMHATILAIIAYQGYFQPGDTHWMVFMLIYGITTLPLLGYMMTKMPRWFRQPPVHYGRYFSCFVMGFTALSAMEYGLVTQSFSWLLWGNLLLLISHAIAMRGVWWIVKWVDLNRHSSLRRLIGYLLVGLAGNLVFLLSTWLDDPLWMEISLISGIVYLWIFSTAGTWLLRNKLQTQAYS